MNYLSVENISKSYGERILFQELFFGLSKGKFYKKSKNRDSIH